MNTKGSATVAFMVGAVAGGVAALLWAPQTGAQLRRRIKDGADDLHAKGERLKESTREKTEAITGTVKGAIAEARHTYKDELERRRQGDGESIARKTGA
jgi:gas vesicle protein